MDLISVKLYQKTDTTFNTYEMWIGMHDYIVQIWDITQIVSENRYDSTKNQMIYCVSNMTFTDDGIWLESGQDAATSFLTFKSEFQKLLALAEANFASALYYPFCIAKWPFNYNHFGFLR